jgi:transaldolase
MERIQSLHALGQSIWYDNIERRLLENGHLEQLIQRGDIRGITSNPSIFNAAIGGSHDYDAALKPMALAGLTAEQIFDRLAIQDIRAAADLFRPLYDETQGGDGYVSIEVNPLLAADTQGTLEEARRLWKEVDRPNLMVKIPATPEGLDAIRQSIAAGININITLIFSIERYRAVMEAYLAGLEERVSANLPIEHIASVASFFVSRMDSKVDAHLEQFIRPEGPRAEAAQSLLGKAAIANARLAYQEFLKVFQSARFQVLRKFGARTQRPLWASTSTKNPAYRDVMYVEELIAADTVNTMPAKTLDAFRDHGEARITIEDHLDEARQVFERLELLGIMEEDVTRELEEEGVDSFSKAFRELLDTVEQRRRAALAEAGM